jgi:hypothetical protein
VVKEGKTTVRSYPRAAKALSKSEPQETLVSFARLALRLALLTDEYQEGAEVAPEPVQHCCKEYKRAACIPGDTR